MCIKYCILVLLFVLYLIQTVLRNKLFSRIVPYSWWEPRAHLRAHTKTRALPAVAFLLS
jgi:hypothetical protein